MTLVSVWYSGRCLASQPIHLGSEVGKGPWFRQGQGRFLNPPPRFSHGGSVSAVTSPRPLRAAMDVAYVVVPATFGAALLRIPWLASASASGVSARRRCRHRPRRRRCHRHSRRRRRRRRLRCSLLFHRRRRCHRLQGRLRCRRQHTSCHRWPEMRAPPVDQEPERAAEQNRTRPWVALGISHLRRCWRRHRRQSRRYSCPRRRCRCCCRCCCRRRRPFSLQWSEVPILPELLRRLLWSSTLETLTDARRRFDCEHRCQGRRQRLRYEQSRRLAPSRCCCLCHCRRCRRFRRCRCRRSHRRCRCRRSHLRCRRLRSRRR